MFKKTSVYATIGFIVIFSCFLAFANQQRKLCGKASIIGEQTKLTPIKDLTIRIQETDDSDVTTDTGRFCIFLKDIYKADDSIRFHAESDEYQIYNPTAGKVRVPVNLEKTIINVLLDKVGSHRFMTTQAFNLLMENIANKAKAEVKADQPKKKPDLTPYLKDWAKQYGFTYEQVKAELDKWAKEETNDLYELGLKAFYEKNFKEAAKNFMLSAKQNMVLSEKKLQESIEHKDNAIRDYRLAGDSYYNDYRFDKALEAYQMAMAEVDKNKAPETWASVMNDLGNTYSNLGIRVGGQKAQEYLKEAVTAYREALKVRTFETLPQDWAMTQNNLGNALQEQGIRTGGKEGAELLSQAVTAYREALKVYKFETLPYYWAQTQGNLASAYLAMENWKGAVECYENVLKFDPNNETAYLQASSIYHDKLYEFEKAYQLDFKWVNEQKHNDLISLSNFIEKHFTTARFTAADKMLSSVFTQIKPDDRLYIPLCVIEIANLKALNKEEAVKAKLANLIEAVKKQPADYRVDWTFSGTRHFVETSDKVVGQRKWLLRFLDAVERENRDKINEGLYVLLSEL